MIHFFGDIDKTIYAVQLENTLTKEESTKLYWLFGNQSLLPQKEIRAFFIGPRPAMVTPWSTNAVEIALNMNIKGIKRIERFESATENSAFDPMVLQKYSTLHQTIFEDNRPVQPILEVDDIKSFNQQESLSLSSEEVSYLASISKKLGRKLTDSEVFGFSQINSEHCRHKIFNGTFIIDEEEKEASLFDMIKDTSKKNPNQIVSAYKDNVAFIEGPSVEQLAPQKMEVPSYYEKKSIETVISLKAETHNFPTTVEPFSGAATGSGGEIRDRLAGGKGSIPLAGTAVYMTPYARTGSKKSWEAQCKERDWLYQTPLDILIKASNGASDFGNKFGQPLITGSLFTFEHEEKDRWWAFDKVIMMAGGIGYGLKDQAAKDTPKKGDKIFLLGGDNYRIGMGGAAVSSVDTGAFEKKVELNAVQRSNPEMQKRVANVIRALVESGENPIRSIHDHGAGGHLNCFSELVEETGGIIYIDNLPLGDPTLSAKEILGNESQERMGLIISKEDAEILKKIAQRENAPSYEVGEVTDNQRFEASYKKENQHAINLKLDDLFGSSPKTIMRDTTEKVNFSEITYDVKNIYQYANDIVQIEAVACKDWLTNKVDRCVTGKVAKQQCVGPLQLPLNNCGVMALDFNGKEGIATAIGHAPGSALIDPKAGSINAITEALTNLIWAPLNKGLSSVSLSANWMWPCNNKGEDARLYEAVKAYSEFAIDLGINVPTGKDSLSMKQKYADKEVLALGTVITSAAGHCDAISKVIEPLLKKDTESTIYYIDLSFDAYELGGSSFAQLLNKVGTKTPTQKNPKAFLTIFNTIQQFIKKGIVQSGHDISSGGMLVTLLELCFSQLNVGIDCDLSAIDEPDIIKLLFSENSGILFQSNSDEVPEILNQEKISFYKIGKPLETPELKIKHQGENYLFSINELRNNWFKTSFEFDKHQAGEKKATERFNHFTKHPLKFSFPSTFSGEIIPHKGTRPKAAILRDKGSNSEREMANALHLAGFDVKDVHMTDLTSGRENLQDISFLAAVGGFSNSDVLGSAKGWAGTLLYNEKANSAITNFFNREDTLSIGVCNGCQLFIELGLIYPEHENKPVMQVNDSEKFECVFSSVTIQPNNAVMLHNLAGTDLGIWSAHKEGKFHLPLAKEAYGITAQYSYNTYPANPNGSDYNTAMLHSKDGRHLVTMPHLERSIFPWNWAHYPEAAKHHKVSPWIQAFINAREWVLEKK